MFGAYFLCRLLCDVFWPTCECWDLTSLCSHIRKSICMDVPIGTMSILLGSNGC